MENIDLTQLESHDYDLAVRDEAGADANTLLSRYHELFTGERVDDELLSKFEKLLVALLRSDTENSAMLTELGFGGIYASDLQAILQQAIVPPDDIQDEAMVLRGKFEELAERYAEHLSGLETHGPIGEPLPSPEETNKYKMRLAVFVVASLLTAIPEDPDDA